MEKFDMAKFLADSGVAVNAEHREQIEYIQLNLIDGDPNNFYHLSGIEDLAANISLCGLQQPIRVREKDGGRYVVVSGHRRRAALDLLVKEIPEHWKEVPCIVERDSVSPALQQLRLIYANANTRAMTSAELGEQAAQVEKLLYQLKEEGYDFPGRMRDHVAQAVNASKTKLARLKVIREKLVECWQPDYKSGALSESAAYQLARIPQEWQQIYYNEKKAAKANVRWLYACDVEAFMELAQKIDKLPCKKYKESSCRNKEAKLKQSVHESVYYCSCTKCCDTCEKLATCKNACPLLADKVKKLRASKKEERQQEKIAREKEEQPVIDYIQGVYARVGKIRQERGISVEDFYEAQSVYYTKAADEKQINLESGNAKIGTDTTLPFGYSFRYYEAKHLCDVADLLGCSIDYLLGREENVSNSDTWHTGNPPKPGEYVTVFEDDTTVGMENDAWTGDRWKIAGASTVTGVIAWAYPSPISPSPLNEDCIAGLSPSGHCGTAAYCDSDADCCLQCDQDCNGQCGWIDKEKNNAKMQ